MVRVNDLHKHFNVSGTEVSIFHFSKETEQPEGKLKVQLM